MDILTRLGVVRRINVAGTLTRLGGSLMEPEVLQAMAQAASASVDIAGLQTAASSVIARVTGAQAGIVTSGASAGLTLATAACLARWDVTRMAALPDTRGMPGGCRHHRHRPQRPGHQCRHPGPGALGDRGGHQRTHGGDVFRGHRTHRR